MNAPLEFVSDLNQHLALCLELLGLVERESRWLRQQRSPLEGEAGEARKNLLPRLDQSLAKLRRHRAEWQRLTPAERSGFPEIGSLLRRNQELTMRILMLDRENEQALLRRGLVPAAHLPPAQRQRPGMVVDLYRRQGVSA